MPELRLNFKSRELPDDIIREIQSVLIKWGKENYRDFPWRKTQDHFHALIAEVMLQRTKAEQVLPIYKSFIKKYPNIQEAAQHDPAVTRRLLHSLGLRWRIEKILELIRELSEIEVIPESRDELIKLPGVGPYVANAFLSLYGNKKGPILDRNAVRFWSRLFGFKADLETHRKKWFFELSDRITPQRGFRQFNYALLDFSAKICTPKPKCNICPLNLHCDYFRSFRQQK